MQKPRFIGKLVTYFCDGKNVRVGNRRTQPWALRLGPPSDGNRCSARQALGDRAEGEMAPSLEQLMSSGEES